ncbi:MAG TPA: response regulator transcription factor [Fimbriimonadaceae bacterium]|nr:response regulator transcription factor [Fimbriimonadaceae bacterium]HRJ96120.1 response regulator transcription factor [Fimbriimonadaceae bacterium]
MKVLLVDDEPTILETVETKLRREGYSVFTAATAEDGMRLYKQARPDLLILDVMLPERSGFDLCKAVRKESKVPILFLTARAGENDRIAGFELGADDYVVKPFNLAELAARVRALLRRSSGGTEPMRVVESGNLKIDPKTHEVTLGGNALSLSPKEFALLHFLAQNPGQVFSRDTLLDRVWGLDAFVNSRTVDVHIHWLRERIEPDPAKPTRLITLRGIGYKFAG